jgi:hypothetical protein
MFRSTTTRFFKMAASQPTSKLHKRSPTLTQLTLCCTTVTIHPPGSPPPLAKNRFSNLIPSQSIAVVSEYKLESGVVLNNVSVGFRTWGKLNER